MCKTSRCGVKKAVRAERAVLPHNHLSDTSLHPSPPSQPRYIPLRCYGGAAPPGGCKPTRALVDVNFPSVVKPSQMQQILLALAFGYASALAPTRTALRSPRTSVRSSQQGQMSMSGDVVLIGVAADSGCGKSTFMRRLTGIFGGTNVGPLGGGFDAGSWETNTLVSDTTTVICLDDYHLNDRATTASANREATARRDTRRRRQEGNQTDRPRPRGKQLRLDVRAAQGAQERQDDREAHL